jgi:hypothetical protein
MAAFYAFIEDGHGFVGGSNLYLHEISLVVVAFRTGSHGSIDVLPSGSTSQDIVHHFTGRKGLFGHHGMNRTGIGTCRAKEVSSRCLIGSLFRVSNL